MASSVVPDYVNASVAQPALSSYAKDPLQHVHLPSFLSGWTLWQYIVTAILGVVLYDQSRYLPCILLAIPQAPLTIRQSCISNARDPSPGRL